MANREEKIAQLKTIQTQIAQLKQQKQSAPEEKGMLRKTWDALDVPRQKAKEGLDMIAKAVPSAEPTGNVVRDVALNAPKVMAETMAETAPGFVDRTAILTAGAGLAAKGAGKLAGKVVPKVAPTLEKGSGLRPGTLNEAYKQPGMIIDFGAAGKAKKLYNEAKGGLEPIKGSVRSTAHPRVVDNALKSLALNKLSVAEAFEARKSVRAMKASKAYNMDKITQYEDLFDDVIDSAGKAGAKVNEADKLYRRGMLGEQMRNISRLNKNGTTGPISAGIMAKIPLLAPLMSPALQGGAVSAAGGAAQLPMRGMADAASMLSNTPDSISAMSELMNQTMEEIAKRKKKKK